MKKKLVSLLLAAAMVLSLSVTALAASDGLTDAAPVLQLSSNYSSETNQVTAVVTLAGCPKLATLEFHLVYSDELLSFVSATPSVDGATYGNAKQDHAVGFTWDHTDPMGSANFVEPQTILTVVFDAAASGNASLRLTNIEITDGERAYVVAADSTLTSSVTLPAGVTQPTTPTNPDQPTNPTEPTNPDQPTQPTQPDPDQPTQPTQPDPDQPTQPTQPDPDQPTQPTQPTQPDPDQPDQPDEDLVVIPTGVSSDSYTIDGQTVTVQNELACRVGYLKDGKYVALEATRTESGAYVFTAPEGVEQVLLVVKGDANGDGIVDVSDILRIKSYNLGTASLDAVQLFATDTSGDDMADVADILRIKAHILGKTTLEW